MGGATNVSEQKFQYIKWKHLLSVRCMCKLNLLMVLRLEVLTAVLLKTGVFLDITLCLW